MLTQQQYHNMQTWVFIHNTTLLSKAILCIETPIHHAVTRLISFKICFSVSNSRQDSSQINYTSFFIQTKEKRRIYVLRKCSLFFSVCKDACMRGFGAVL